jgi:hypothetical protein
MRAPHVSTPRNRCTISRAPRKSTARSVTITPREDAARLRGDPEETSRGSRE